MGKLKVGLVGLRRGQGYVRTIAHHPELEVAALCDLKPQVLADRRLSFGGHDDTGHSGARVGHGRWQVDRRADVRVRV